MDNLTGRVIKTYELREQLGAGGFGAVYRAYQQVVGREVAIKVILPEYANHPDFIYRFETEAQLVARLEHPHIVPLYDYWREPDGAYLVMRWLRTSLRAELKNGPWSAPATSRLLDQLAGALTLAHRHSIIHRDIKPDNILLDDECNAYLADFGIAKKLGKISDATQQGILLGSPMYFTPEQIRGEPVTPQSDLYSLGIVLYELLTGEKPFSPDLELTALIAKHLNEPLPNLAAKNADVPSRLNTVIQRATAKNPEDRYPTALALAEAFHQALNGSQVRSNIQVTSRKPTPASSEDPTLLEAVITADNPYKGLRAFQEADASDFFGREALTQQLLKRLAESGEGSHFLAVVGPSGSGKSSVVRAGLIPALRNGTLPGSRRWFIVEMIPGAHPFEELEGALLRVAVNPPTSLLGQLREDERGLLRALKRVLPGEETSELVLVIDQFEEVFTLVENEAERAQFLNNLLMAVHEPRGRLRVVVTLRADFYDRPLLYPGFGELMRNRMEVVLPLSTDEMEQAITRPAERVGITLQTGLLTAIVNDIAQQPGELPMLQYALTELFERRQENRLTLDAYRASGGVVGVLARRAEELFAELKPMEQIAARQLFLRLITLGEGVEDTRRRVKRAELASVGNDPQAVDRVIDLYSQHRLFTFDRDPITRGPTVEVAHEALIRTWPRLRSWLEESREDLRLQRRLIASSVEWVNAGRDPSFLATGGRLVQFETLAAQATLALNEEEAAYLSASIAERTARQTAEESRTARELRFQRSAANRMRYVIAVLLLALVGFGVLAGIASTNEQRAIVAQGQALDSAATSAASLSQFRRAVSFQLAEQANHLFESTDKNPELIALLSIRSLQAGYSSNADMILSNALDLVYTRQTFTGHTQEVSAVAISPDSRFVLTSSLDKTVRLWDAQTGKEVRRFTDVATITSLAISPDGRYALIGDGNNTGQLWDIQTGQPTLQFDKFKEQNIAVFGVAFSPDGRWVLTGSSDATVHLWDAQTGAVLRDFKGHTDSVNSVAFSPDGRWVLTGGSDATARLWDAQTGAVLHTFTDTGAVRSVMVSPDNTMVLTSGFNGATLWDLQTYSQSAVFTVPQVKVFTAILSSDGNSVVLGDNNGTVWLFNAHSKRKPRSFSGHTRGINGIAFSSDGTSIVTGSSDGTARLWDVNHNTTLRAVSGQVIHHSSFSLSADGLLGFTSNNEYGIIANDPGIKRLWNLQSTTPVLGVSPDHKFALIWSSGHTGVIGSDGFGVQLWDFNTGQPVRTFTGHSGPITAGAFSPDSNYVVTTSVDKTVRLWDVKTGQEIRQYLGHSGVVVDAVFSPDGNTLLTASEDHTARLWDVQTGQQRVVFANHTDNVNQGTFSRDGKYVVTTSRDGTTRLWDVLTGQELRQFRVADPYWLPITVTFSPDGHSVAIGGWLGPSDMDGHLWVGLWDVQTGQKLRWFSLAGIDTVFSPDGKMLLTGNHLWNSAIDDQIAFACAHIFRDFTDDERQTYGIPDKTPTCPQFGATPGQ